MPDGKRNNVRGRWIPLAIVGIVLVVGGLMVSGFVFGVLISLESPTSEIEYSVAAVATDVKVCSEMAGKVLESNGTAVDAAITAMLCVGAVNPQSSGIGGGGFMVVYQPTTESVYSFNFREMAPAAYNSETKLEKTGGLAVAVPGELAGMEMVHKKFGILPWKRLFEPVINITRDGFTLTEHSAEAIKSKRESLKDNPVFKKWYCNSGGKLKEAGDTVQRVEYSDLLSMIAKEGPGILYNGDIAEEIVNEVTKNGGKMTMDDMASYHVRQDSPLMVKYSDMEVYAPPVPAGGSNLLFALNVMEMLGLSRKSVDVSYTYQHLVETFRYMFAKRSYLGDPYCPTCAMDSDAIFKAQTEMISEEYAQLVNQSISNSQTSGSPNYLSPDGGTSHISIVDSNKMAVTVTTSINTYFGSLLITPSGIVLNNEMSCFSTDPNGFKGNLVRPMKRPLSSACPIIVLKTGESGRKFPYLTIGASGGRHIPTAVAQASLGVLSYEKSLSDAIEAKRLYVDVDYNKNTVYTEGDYPEKIASFLESQGYTVMEDDKLTTVVQGVRLESSGAVTAKSDKRKGKEANACMVPC